MRKLPTFYTPKLAVANPDSSLVAEDREANLNTAVKNQPEASSMGLPDKRGGTEASSTTRGLAAEGTVKANQRPGSRRTSKRKGRGGKTDASKPHKK